MCGIAGFVGNNNLSEEEFNFLNSELLKTIVQRGPDNYGFYREEDLSILLVHSRLSIRDLSSNGNQPMVSKSGRYVLVFNGEIYNSDELKNSQLFKNHSFKGTSDTEILVGLIDMIGVDETLSLIDGMFAFAIWDKFNCNLGLYRDSYGEKPLY